MQTAEMVKLTDEQMMAYIVNGFHLVELEDIPASFHSEICASIDALESNPLDDIINVIPALHEVYDHPKVVGALASILGDDFEFPGHIHWHCKPPGSGPMHWHQDGKNRRDVWKTNACLAMYYPQDVTPDMGPTIVVPGTHFRNAPTDRMANYYNIRGQVPLTVKAGTVAITHRDIWHGTGPNTTDRPRHMIKRAVRRVSEPTAPNWRHDPDQADALLGRGSQGALAANFVTARTVPTAQSDHYKERALRMRMWEWYCGKAAD